MELNFTALDTLYFIHWSMPEKLWRKEMAEINGEWKESPNNNENEIYGEYGAGSIKKAPKLGANTTNNVNKILRKRD